MVLFLENDPELDEKPKNWVTVLTAETCYHRSDFNYKLCKSEWEMYVKKF
jgi:hypothetical protein